MAVLATSRGQQILIDDADEAWLGQWRWRINKAGYAYRRPKPRGAREISMSRLITGAGPGHIVDHVNRVRHDNRRENLRFVTAEQNAANASPHRDGVSRFRGVKLKRAESKGAGKKPRPPRWLAAICGRKIGRFLTEEEAALAWNRAAREKWGDFAFQNVVTGDASSWVALPLGKTGRPRKAA